MESIFLNWDQNLSLPCYDTSPQVLYFYALQKCDIDYENESSEYGDYLDINSLCSVIQ